MIKKSVTMSDIAKAMNVSTVTVSKALGGREGTKGTVDEQIMKALEAKDTSQSALISAGKANL